MNTQKPYRHDKKGKRGERVKRHTNEREREKKNIQQGEVYELYTQSPSKMEMESLITKQTEMMLTHRSLCG